MLFLLFREQLFYVFKHIHAVSFKIEFSTIRTKWSEKCSHIIYRSVYVMLFLFQFLLFFFSLLFLISVQICQVIQINVKWTKWNIKWPPAMFNNEKERHFYYLLNSIPSEKIPQVCVHWKAFIVCVEMRRKPKKNNNQSFKYEPGVHTLKAPLELTWAVFFFLSISFLNCFAQLLVALLTRDKGHFTHCLDYIKVLWQSYLCSQFTTTKKMLKYSVSVCVSVLIFG